MAGYSTDQELLTLRKFGPKIKPNIVVLFFCFNDLAYNDSKFGHRVPKPRFIVNVDSSLTLDNVPVPQRPKQNLIVLWIKKNSALAQLVITNIQRRAFEKQTERAVSTGRNGMDTEKDITYYLLKGIRDECERLEAKLIFFNTPANRDDTERSPVTPRGIQQILRWCSDLEITAVDLFPIFHKDFKENGDDLYIWDGMHWNENGHQLVGQELLKILKSKAESKSLN
jgi:lysophospholipase L1-like esterase